MIFFASDHAGFNLKQVLVEYCKNELKLEVEDLGAHEQNPEDDYPEIIALAAKAVSENPENRAIILGGSGQGEAMVANRFPNVRAVVWYGGTKIPELSREHNDSNILSIGARFVTEDEARMAVKAWLETDFSGEERHVRRLANFS